MDESLKRKKAIYRIINLVTSIIVVAMALANLIFNIVAEFVPISVATHLALAITFSSIELIALVPLIISWTKLRKIEKELTKETLKNSNSSNE